MKNASIRFPSGPETPQRQKPHIIVFGNEKGGSGKSTSAMHVVIALMKRGFQVGVVDLDARQGTLSRMAENRELFARESGLKLKLPRRHRVYAAKAETMQGMREEDQCNFAEAMDDLADCDFIVVDTPGTDTYLSRLGHSRADTLITPLNDSFLDLDLLARIDPSGRKILGPSVYAEMVWEQRQERARDGRTPTDWIVMRNRLAHLNARNKKDIGRLLQDLSRRIGFRLAPGFSERVIFRELFPKGLTLLDLRERGVGVSLNMSHVAAREEVRGLLDAIGVAEPRQQEGQQTDMFAASSESEIGAAAPDAAHRLQPARPD